MEKEKSDRKTLQVVIKTMPKFLEKNLYVEGFQGSFGIVFSSV
jgi:hypothetical protein